MGRLRFMRLWAMSQIFLWSATGAITTGMGDAIDNVFRVIIIAIFIKFFHILFSRSFERFREVYCLFEGHVWIHF